MAKYCGLVLAILLCMIVFGPHAESITCGTVLQNLSPCRPALRQGGAVTASCCSGIKSINSASNTTPARRAACDCIKRAAKSYKFQSQTASAVLKKCNVNIGFPISTTIDCTKVN